MNTAFIVIINLDDLSDLPGVAAEISDDLSASGFEVTAVHAWARPALTTNVPTTQTPTTNINQQV